MHDSMTSTEPRGFGKSAGHSASSPSRDQMTRKSVWRLRTKCGLSARFQARSRVPICPLANRTGWLILV